MRVFLLVIILPITACQHTAKHDEQSSSTAQLKTNSAPLLTVTKSEPLIATSNHVKSSNVDEKKDVVTAKPSYTNLWLDIRSKLSLKVPNKTTIKNRKAWYLAHPNYMNTINRRAAPYLYHIVKEVEKRQLPIELALLPLVESDFQIDAISIDGATGIWQLMPHIAKHYDVTINDEYDGRLDVITSTNAALDYLTYLHKHFDGDWLLAIAAYNSGEGKVKRAIRQNKLRGKKTDFWSLKLPQETAFYVPKLLAVADLLNNKPHSFHWPELANDAKTVHIDIGQPFDMLVISQLTQLDTRFLYQLNPAYLVEKAPENGPYKLLLPKSHSNKLRHTLLLTKLANNQGVHKVSKGDSLYKLSHLYNISIEDLKLLNQLKSDLIRLGDSLIVPKLKDIDTIKLTRDYTISPFLERAQKPKKEYTRVQYQVRKGDTLWSISELYDVTFKQLAKWNNISERTLLKPGKTLTLWIERQPTLALPTTENIPILTRLNYLISGPGS